MARKHHIDGLFSRISKTDFHKRFRSMSPLTLHAYVAIELEYWGSGKENPIAVSQRWLADQIDCDPKTANKLIAELREAGFLRVARQGKFMGGLRTSRRSWYFLTWLPEKGDEADEGNFPPLTRENMDRTRGKFSPVEKIQTEGAIKAPKAVTTNGLSALAPIAFRGAA